MVDWSGVSHGWVSMGGNLAAELELMIVRGELPRGEKIPAERVLAETLGVSRTTLREALLELELRGLVSRRPGRGTIVLESSTPKQAEELSSVFSAAQEDFNQIMEMRCSIEPGVTALAAAKATPSDLRKLEAILRTAEQETSSAKLLELDVEFHVMVADIARNPLLSMLIRIVSDWARSSRRLGFQGASRKSASLSGHWAIVESLKAGNGPAAEQAMRDHIGGIQELIAPVAEPGPAEIRPAQA